MQKKIIFYINATAKLLMLKGLAKSIFSKFPFADIYSIKHKRVPGHILSKTEKKITIINLLGQNFPGKPRKYETREQRLTWFKNGLSEVKKIKPISMAIPFKIGCGLAGGKWMDYKTVLEEFEKDLGIELICYKIE